MNMMKAWYHLIAYIQFVFYKMIYGKQLEIGKNVTWRRGFSIMKKKKAVVKIGDNCFFNNDCSIAANTLVVIGGGVLFGERDRKSTRLNSSHSAKSRMPSSA